MLKEQVIRQKREVEELLGERFVERDAGKNLEKWMDKDIIKVVSGIRRGGKSFLSLQTLKEKKFGYINFDDEILASVDFNTVLKHAFEVYGEFKILFLDEIQNLDKWELIVNRLKRQGYNLIISGSNANLLSSELSTHLTGRYIEIEIFPFSFAEFLRAREEKLSVEVEEDRGKILNLLNEYLQTGGFPEVVVKGFSHKEYISTLVNAIVMKDVIKRHKPKYPDVILNIAKFLSSNISAEISLTKIKNTLSVGSVHTVEKYINYLKEAYLIVLLERFSFKAKERMVLPKKTYVMDTGIHTAFGFRLSENTGRLMENLVAVELLRRRSYFKPEMEVFYFKNAQGREVDFVVKEGLNVKELIQVTYANDFDEVEHREIRALLKAQELLKCKELKVITWDYEDERVIRWFGRQGRIKFVPLWKWLLNITQ